VHFNYPTAVRYTTRRYHVQTLSPVCGLIVSPVTQLTARDCTERCAFFLPLGCVSSRHAIANAHNLRAPRAAHGHRRSTHTHMPPQPSRRPAHTNAVVRIIQGRSGRLTSRWCRFWRQCVRHVAATPTQGQCRSPCSRPASPLCKCSPSRRTSGCRQRSAPPQRRRWYSAR